MRLSKRSLENWLIALLVVVFLVACVAVTYNAVVTAQPRYIVPNIYFEQPTPEPPYFRKGVAEK